MTETYPVFPFIGILTETGEPSSARLIKAAAASMDHSTLSILNDVGLMEDHETTSITVDPITARMEFVSDGKNYRIREPRESDGRWLSKYKVTLPTDALRAFTIRGDSMNPDETLDAYATEDSPYIIGLVYTNGVGRWSRVDGDWVLLSPTDDSFDEGDVFEIDPERADEFISLYDSNYVSVTDAEQYESAESEELDAQSDNNSDD